MSFTVYVGWNRISCELRNTEPEQGHYANQSFCFLDYLAHVKLEQRGPAWQRGGLVDDNFEAFTAMVKSEFGSDLKTLLLGENWLDVPFDWQGQSSRTTGPLTSYMVAKIVSDEPLPKSGGTSSRKLARYTKAITLPPLEPAAR